MVEEPVKTRQPKFRFHKLRLWLAWIGGAFLFVSSHASDKGFRIGIPITFAGMLMRIWASGYIERKNRKLATAGPFAHVRNPLYVGNFLIGLGIVAIVQNWLTTIVFLIGFVILYRGTVRKEENELATRFGTPYQDYLAAVPRFFPRLMPYPRREKTRFQWKLLLKHREIETFLAILLILTGLYLWEEIVLEGKFVWKEKLGIAVALGLIAALSLERALRDYQKSLFPEVIAL